jgi:basic membrane lipoprotein Med (substrate-binding protein (PBP1-ABC) superfamily)
MVNQTNKFNSAGYIFIDFDASYFQGNTTDNIPQNPNANHIASLTFRADQSAFFAGLATCQYLNDN